MSKKENWLKVSSVILFAGGVLFFLFSPIALIPHTDIRIVAALFAMPVFLLSSVLIPCMVYHGKDLWKVLELDSLKESDIKPVLSSFLIFFSLLQFRFYGRKSPGKSNLSFLYPMRSAVRCGNLF